MVFIQWEQNSDPHLSFFQTGSMPFYNAAHPFPLGMPDKPTGYNSKNG
ncbi:hypothetical protein [Saezia sanguinis]|nr:hypothetical protein [Saezia sanguinis]